MTTLLGFVLVASCLASVQNEYLLLDKHNNEKLGARYLQEGHAPVPEMKHWISLVQEQPTMANSSLTICEIGFNAGHSAAAWTHHYPNAQYISFDLFNKNVSDVARSYLKTRNIRYIIGDTTRTLLNDKFACDVISIDGDHRYKGALADLLNMQRHANSNHILIMDDLSCEWWWCRQPTEAWKHMVSSGHVQEIGCKSIGCCTGWCWGKYKKKRLNFSHAL